MMVGIGRSGVWVWMGEAVVSRLVKGARGIGTLRKTHLKILRTLIFLLCSFMEPKYMVTCLL